MTSSRNPFDAGLAAAVEYDSWYDSSLGRSVLEAEASCVRQLLEGAPRPCLEIGAGSGRFGGELNVDVGLDSALDLLGITAPRLPSVVRGIAEALPFRDASGGAVLAVTVLEFVADAGRALHEASRMLRRDGRLVPGFIPRGGPWGIAYHEEERAPTSVFHSARFVETDELVDLAAGVGLQLTAARSTLLAPPGGAQPESVAEKSSPEAGFLALAFEPQAPTERYAHD